MRTVRWILAFVLILCSAAAARAAHHEALMDEVRALGDALEKAMVEDDTEFLFGLYAEGAISLPNYGPRMDGVDEFRAHHEQMEAAGMKILSFTSDPTDVWQAGDQVIEIGTYEIELEMPGMPAPVEDHGKYLTVYVRDADGALKIKAETWNTDVNPMEMMMGGDDAMGAHEGHEGHGAHGDRMDADEAGDAGDAGDGP